MCAGASPPTVYQPDVLGSQLFQARIKAHDVLQEHLKQIITIASATLALTVTFLKDIVGIRGAKAIWGWLLPGSWIALGFSIAIAIWTISILVNNLDWARETNPKSGRNESYTVGVRFRINRAILASFTTFSLGMLFLGFFAAINYDLLLYRVRDDYTIKSAAQAIAKAKTKLLPDISQVRVSKVDLIKGVYDSPPSDQVWHVQFEYEKKASSAPPISAPTRGEKPASAIRAEKPAMITLDLFIDATTGAVTEADPTIQ
jgi:hypothetical protein